MVESVKIHQTEFMFFKNTPLVDFQNTIHFKSNNERDNFFLNENHYNTIPIYQNNFNYIRDKSTIDVNYDYFQFLGVNYCTFLTTWDKRFYAYVLKIEYINDRTTRVHLLIDGIMTYTQGKKLESIANLKIDRQHLSKAKYQTLLPRLKTNDDVLNVTTKRYVKQDIMTYTDFYLMFFSKVDLSKSYGTADNPKFSTSTGTTYDNITSPVNIYIAEDYGFKSLMTLLQDYPWITQNFTNVIKIPKVFISESSLEEVEISSKEGFEGLYSLKAGHSKKDLNLSLSKTKEELYQIFKLNPEKEAHLLRNHYCNIEMYTWDGNILQIDVSQLKDDDMTFYSEGVIGFKNEIHYYINGYKYSSGYLSGELQGNFNRNSSFLNDCITITNFDEVPMLIDNYKLSLAQNANQRKLEESKLVSNRIANVLDPNADMQSRFMDGVSLLSNLSPGDLFGKFTDEYEYYRTQKAQWQDLALTSPTITNQTTGYAFQLAKEIFGITTFFATMNDEEWQKIKLYYKEFGYQVELHNSYLDNVESMTMANYVKFSGSWTLPDLEIGLIEMMKAQFENGVRLWHNNGTKNPMTQKLINNEWVND